MNTGKQKGTVSIRIDVELLEQIKREAKEENRSLSSYLEGLLYRFGYGTPDQTSPDLTVEEQRAIRQGLDDIRNGRFTVYEDPSKIWESIQ